jgi:hypothetical protein
MTQNEKRAQKLIVEQVEITMKLLENHLQKYCDENKTASVPINYIRTSVALLLTGYKKGVKESAEA